MKTSGFRCETKFGLLVFLGHPIVHVSFSPPLFWKAFLRHCSMSTSITDCCMTKIHQIIMDQSACMACLRRGQGRQSPCVCRREFRMNSRRKGSPPQCFGDLARKNSLSTIVNTFAKLLLNPLFHLIWASWPRSLQLVAATGDQKFA